MFRISPIFVGMLTLWCHIDTIRRWLVQFWDQWKEGTHSYTMVVNTSWVYYRAFSNKNLRGLQQPPPGRTCYKKWLGWTRVNMLERLSRAQAYRSCKCEHIMLCINFWVHCWHRTEYHQLKLYGWWRHYTGWYMRSASMVWKKVGNSKASELVPCSLLPHWNSMRFFATVSLYDSNSMDEVKFATLCRRSSNITVIVTCTLLCCDDVMYVPALWNFKKLTCEPYPYSKKYTTFSFPIHEALTSDICLRNAPTCSCIQLYT